MATNKTASLLPGLAIVDVRKPTGAAASKDPVKNFIGSVDKMVALVEKQKAGEDVSAIKRKMHWQKNGEWFVTVSYGGSPLDLGGGMSTVQAGKTLDDVLKVYEALKDNAAKNEDFQSAISAKAAEISARLHGKRGKRK